MDVVLNWIWQGAVVALSTAAVLRALAPCRPQARYAVLWVASMAVLALPGVPLVWARAVPAPAAHDPIAFAPLLPMPLTWWTSTTLALALWTAWVALHGVRLAIALVRVRAARQQCSPCPPDVEARLHHWTMVRGAGRRTRLVLSRHVQAAAVLGGGAPVIALAPALLEHFEDDDLDRVVIHEWAHVQRRDDVALFAELLVRLVMGWHPAWWWLGRQLHVEREAACDAMAVAVTGSATRYAACLTTLAAFHAEPARPFPALAAASSTGLRARIVRILSLSHSPSIGSWRRTSLAVTVLLATLAVGVGGVEVVGTGSRAALALQGRQPALQDGSGGSMTPASAPGLSLSGAEFPDAVGPQGRERPLRIERAIHVTVDPPYVPPAPMAPEGDAPYRRAVRGAEGVAPAAPALPARAVAWSPHGLPRVLEHGSTPSSRSALREDAAVVAGRWSAPPWAAAAETGRAMGRGSERAAQATAGFFNRLGSKIASSF